MDEQTLVVRRVDKKAYRKFRQKAIERRLNVGKALTSAMEKWIAEEDEPKKDPRNFLKIVGSVKMGKKGMYSEEIDKVVYG